MRFDLLLDGKTYKVELGIGNTVMVKLDGETYEAEVVKEKHGVNILLDGKKSFIRLTGGNVSVDGQKHDVEVRNLRRGRPSWFRSAGETKDISISSPSPGGIQGEGPVYPPMPGRVVSINVNTGDTVKIGTPILVLEAMKMQNELVSKWEGVVREIRVSQGDLVETSEVLMVIGE